MLLAAIAMMMAAIAISGCSTGSMEDLRVYTEQILSRKSKKVERIPDLKPYEVYAYSSGTNDGKDPFEPFFQNEPEKVQKTAKTGGLQPDFNRNREELETYPLDTLRMVGTLERDNQIWGLVLNSEGSIFRVQVGNYMGRNHGKITSIIEDSVDLMEIIPDGLGGFEERQAAMALVE
ncbi:MAG: pilus assembly protein PilP [Gammaproteobacteria bacterium]|nr:MAG: pilus assembly protein PilP [Gammaproteobacteria bacterium]